MQILVLTSEVKVFFYLDILQSERTKNVEHNSTDENTV